MILTVNNVLNCWNKWYFADSTVNLQDQISSLRSSFWVLSLTGKRCSYFSTNSYKRQVLMPTIRYWGNMFCYGSKPITQKSTIFWPRMLSPATQSIMCICSAMLIAYFWPADFWLFSRLDRNPLNYAVCGI